MFEDQTVDAEVKRRISTSAIFAVPAKQMSASALEA